MHGTVHDDEPDTQNIILEDSDIEVIDDDSDSMLAMRVHIQDWEIIFHAIFGHDVTEVYSNSRIRIAPSRQLVTQILSTNGSEMYSPEPVNAVCEQRGLKKGQAMDIKNGYDCDLAIDRKEAWDSIIRDEPRLVIGSHPSVSVQGVKQRKKHV